MNLSPLLQQVDRTYVLVGKRKLSYFGGSDYFRLSSHPQVLAAASAALKQFGLNVSASRFTTGNHHLYGELEDALQKFFGAESATLASSGYAPNLIAAQALAGNFSHALVDERSHVSLMDAAQFLDCPVIKFKHRDAADLKRILKRLSHSKPIVMTDGMFSHDSSIAPLNEYMAALPLRGMLLVDDAHGGGVLGKNGRGSAEHAGLPREHIVQTVTLSKAFGVYGGAVVGSHKVRAAIMERSRMFVGNTPLPLPLANAALKSVTILKSDKSLRARFAANIGYAKGKLRAAGFPLNESPGPIIPFAPRNSREAESLKKRLAQRAIHAPFIKYPGGPKNGYFRFALSSEHTKRQLYDFVAALVG